MDKGELLPDGVRGEICITGKGLGKGYLNQVKLSNEKFVENPYSKHSGDKKIYKTGDLGRYNTDGILEYFGRIDKQVKLRGYRIELSEIEKVLEAYEAVKQAVVLITDDTIVAYLVNTGEIDLLKLRIFLASILVDYMIPAYFVCLEAIPLNSNAKIDTEALLQLDYHSASMRREFVEARNAIDSQLIEIWEEVLEHKHIGITDLFIDLGGQSLKAIRIINRIEERMNYKFTANELYEFQTIERLSDEIALAQWIDNAKENTESGRVITI